ncbi:MAG TPA: flagellar biosynthesis protein FlgH [Deltaproteobacteria bacterium]|nr:flagellar biosynthesis protein FlgH [Deltaproteobacteria bacterium]
MMINKKKVVRNLILWGLLIVIAGCSALAPPPPPQPIRKQLADNPARRQRQPTLNTSRNALEGSLWRSEASFGNLFRDHRARYRGDLLTIQEVDLISNVPPPKEGGGDGGQAAAAPQNEVQAASLALEALTLRNAIEEEQNEILRGLNTISARVVRVYPDGNMLISGQKVDYRQRNQVRYVTTLQGVLRPADVSGENLVSATKLVNPEIKVRRQQSSGLVRERLEQLAPLIGSDAAGLAGRLSDLGD